MLTPGHTHTWTVNGTELRAEIWPCSWMYVGHALQLKVIMLPDGGHATILCNGVTMHRATPEDVVARCANVRVTTCSRCGKPAFDPATIDTNRKGLCESCFMTDINAAFTKAEEREEKKRAKTDAKMAKDGYTHRISAWIHPSRGDDRCVEIYVKGEPTREQIQAELKRLKSRVLTDYTVTKLETKNVESGSPGKQLQ